MHSSNGLKMPGLLKKDKLPGVGHQVEDVREQSRQPRGLEGLLRFAMDTTRNEDASGPSISQPMDEERKKFLEDALKSMTIDVIELFLKQINVFANVENISADSDVTEYTSAFDTILDYVDNMDIANDFHKIGGFTIFTPCLTSAHPKVRAGACHLIAELTQNNPYCQGVITVNGFIPLLLYTLNHDEDEVCNKALYALSSIVRDNENGLNEFMRRDGLDVVLETIKKADDKLRTKSAFLLSALCQMRSNLKEKLITDGYLQVLMSILSEEHKPSHEHVLSLMKNLTEDNEMAVLLCRDPQYGLQSTLKNNLELTKDKEEFCEEYEYCQHLLTHLFPGWNN